MSAASRSDSFAALNYVQEVRESLAGAVVVKHHRSDQDAGGLDVVVKQRLGGRRTDVTAKLLPVHNHDVAVQGDTPMFAWGADADPAQRLFTAHALLARAGFSSGQRDLLAQDVVDSVLPLFEGNDVGLQLDRFADQAADILDGRSAIEADDGALNVHFRPRQLAHPVFEIGMC